MCFVNAVLQLLVHSPPFWNLFRELGDLKGQCGEAGLDTRGGATPLVDATVRFFEEFMFKQNEPPPMQKPPQQAAGEEQREGEEAKKEHSSVDSLKPTYMYDAMKEKRQLKALLVCPRALDASFCY
jgi:ubiquitin carboxyl-terminal hydrolase 10